MILIKILNEQREEKRKVYDHYEKKLLELTQEKEKKIKKGMYQENSNFARKIERVIHFIFPYYIILNKIFLL